MADKKSLPSFYSEPQIIHLAQMLEEIDRGQLLIPKFQRPFVWSRDQRLALLESVLQGIPIGTIMVWRTHRRPGHGEPPDRHIEIKRELGPFRLPSADEDSPVFQYVLDGEQRLMTLYFALYGTPDSSLSAPGRGSERDDFIAYYDLFGDTETAPGSGEGAEASRFVFRSDIQGEVGPRYLPLADIVSGTRLSRFQRELAKSELFQKDASKVDRATEESDRVADAFRRYKLPSVPITTDDLPLLTKTFERINSNHTTMSEVHMVNALTWSEGFDLLDMLADVREGTLAQVGWSGLEDEIFLRVSKIELGLPVYEVSVETLSRRLREQPEVVPRVAQRLCRVAQFFREYCGVYAPELVPYTIQIVLIAGAFLEDEEPGREGCELLRDWVWYTTYAETFGRRLNESQISKFLSVSKRHANGKRLVRPLEIPKRRRLERFDFRHARSRALALLLARRRSERSAEEAYDLLASKKVEAVPQIITAPMAGADRSKSPGARVLATPEEVRALQKCLHSSGDRELVDIHVISAAAVDCFRAGRYREFVELREADLDDLEAEHYDAVIQNLFVSDGS